jgi:hypothetical protein
MIDLPDLPARVIYDAELIGQPIDRYGRPDDLCSVCRKTKLSSYNKFTVCFACQRLLEKRAFVKAAVGKVGGGFILKSAVKLRRRKIR